MVTVSRKASECNDEHEISLGTFSSVIDKMYFTTSPISRSETR